MLIICGTARSAIVHISFSGQDYEKRIQSVKELKEKGVMLQTDEFTCGVAALATLLSAYGDDTVTEEDLLAQEKDLERGKGITLLQLKILAEKRGFKAEGYRMDLVNLFDFKKPMLLHIRAGDEGHYVVFKGIYKDRIYLADPAAGNVRMSLEDFGRIWTGVVLAIESRNGQELVNVFDPPAFAQPEMIAVKVKRR